MADRQGGAAPAPVAWVALPSWLPSWLPASLALAGATLFIVSLAVVPLLLVRLPADTFVRSPRPHGRAVRVARNLAGALLVALGLLMLVLPGQGMLTILGGLALLDLPIKARVVRRLLRQRNVQAAVQGLRARAGRPAFLVPGTAPGVPEPGEPTPRSAPPRRA